VPVQAEKKAERRARVKKLMEIREAEEIKAQVQL
jgi:hypothetical protein